MWSGKLAEAEREYLEILAVVSNDPDNWMGLASVYSREDRTTEALQALDRAVELDPKRADLRAARGRALQAALDQSEAKLEFHRALDLDPTSTEARAGLLSLRGEPKHEVRVGVNADLFSFADANHDEGLSLTSHWASRWTTSVAGSVYRREGTDAEKLVVSATGNLPKWGALTVGGAAANDDTLFRKMKHSSITTKGGNSEEEPLYAEWKLTTGSTGKGPERRRDQDASIFQRLPGSAPSTFPHAPT
jgi:tetratricopeptide (TPR) repeat protein